MKKTWAMAGGLHLPGNKQQSLGGKITTLPLPDKLLIPLHQSDDTMVNVSVGDRVLKGQTIAKYPASAVSSAPSISMHAPTSGTVTAMAKRPIAHPSGMVAPCIEISSDGRDQWIAHHGLQDYHKATADTLLDRLCAAGVIGMGGAGWPTAIKLNPGKQRPIHHLIINGAECEPYVTADDALMRERAGEIVEGIEVLCHILNNPDHVTIGIEDNKPEAIQALQNHTIDRAIDVVSFTTKYPSGGEKQLIYTLTGHELPSGKIPADIGVLCINVATVYGVKRAVIHGEPLISRVTTVTGDACGIKGTYEVLVGTPVSHLLAHSEFDRQHCARLIMGGPMTGLSLETAEVPVVKTSQGILALGDDEVGETQPAQPCIRCGTCAEVCPALLLPQQLLWHAQADDHHGLQAHHLFDCIECGACDYVCPSHIPLVQYYRNSKGDILKAEQQRAQSDRARQRFEFHQQRIQQAAQQKKAQREERRKAVKQEDKSSKKSAKTADIMAIAKARASAKKATPQQQRARLERTLCATAMGLQGAEEKLASALSDGNVSDAKRNALRAAVEDARQKHQQAQSRLAESMD